MSTWGRDEMSMMGLRRVLGDALQAAYLVESDVPLEPAEMETLRRAAQMMESVQAFTQDDDALHAVPASAIELMTATKGLSPTASLIELRNEISELAESLDQMAQGQIPGLGLDKVITRLKGLHTFAHAVTARVPHEVH